jgi:hypothetical protein
MGLTQVSTNGVKDDAVNFNKIGHIDSGRILARVSSGLGQIETPNASQVRTLLNVADGANQTTINNQADNRMITCTGTSDTLNAEQYLTYTSQSSLNLTDGVGTSNLGGNYLLLKRASGNTNYLNAPLADAELYISADEAIRFATVHTADFNSTEQMRIDSSGNVGIGVTDVKAALQVNSNKNAETDRHDGSNYHLFLRNPNDDTGEACGLAFSVTSNATKTGSAILFEREGGGSIGSMQFYTNGDGNSVSERMRLTSTGKFYVGTTNGAFANNASQHAAIVNSAANVYTLSLRNNLDSSDGRGLLIAAGNGGGGRLIFFERFDGSTLGSITVASSSSVSYNTSSDYRLKENVTTITDGITRLKTLKPSKFNWKDDPDTTFDGFIAHEVSSVVPEAITGTKDEVDSDNNPVYQGIDQSKLVPLLTAALQEEVAKREALETRVAALEAA